MNDTNELRDTLRQFTGTDQWYRHSLNREMLYTDGVQFFAENAGGGAYWFLDIAATELMPLLKKEPFLHIVLTVSEKSDCKILVDDGNYNPVYERDIEWTDCPFGNWGFYLTDNVLLLPSEY